MKLTLPLLLCISLLASCASEALKNCDQQPTQTERKECRAFVFEYNYEADMENLRRCEQIYRAHGATMVFRGPYREGRLDRADVKDALAVNRCRQIIGSDAWVDGL